MLMDGYGDKVLPVIWAGLLHVLLIVVAVFGVDVFSSTPPYPTLAVKGRIVTEGEVVRNTLPEPAVEEPDEPEEPLPEPELPEPEVEEDDSVEREAEEQRLREVEEERQQQVRVEEQKRAAEEKQRQETQAREKAEKEAVERAEAEAKRKADEQAERERLEKERQQAAEEKRKKELEEKQARERAEVERKRKEEAARQAELDEEMRRVMADENRLNELIDSGEMAIYVAQIKQKVERNWVRPASARSGLKCNVSVRQIAGGEVVGVRIGECNGDDAVKRSIEAAVYKASPLPLPSDPSLFDRELLLVFNPPE